MICGVTIETKQFNIICNIALHILEKIDDIAEFFFSGKDTGETTHSPYITRFQFESFHISAFCHTHIAIQFICETHFLICLNAIRIFCSQ